MMMGARLVKKPNRRSNGCETENVSPEVNDGFTVAKLEFVVKRVLVMPTLTPVPLWNVCEKPVVEAWLSVLSVDAPFSDDALGEVERVGVKPATKRGSKGARARCTA